MDEKDRKIVEILQKNGREQFNVIARKVSLSSAAVHARVIKLERAGIIEGYSTRIDAKKLGLNIEVLLNITVDHSKDDSEKTLKEIIKLKGVISAFTMTGDWDYQIRLFIRDISDLNGVTTKVIKQAVPHMIRSSTSIVMARAEKPLDW
ncbi:Lrp/AsnC family transcriptional regulator [Candidatus Woesearchaeota archaeon]|nr:Lrp/AsnC family transcriptional regulator [Candidatus Woesearchaeota archaeon]